MVAMPGLQTESSLPLTSMLSSSPVRADALLILDCKSQSGGISTVDEEATRAARVNYHGRY
jgi:hypothetical protein